MTFGAPRSTTRQLQEELLIPTLRLAAEKSRFYKRHLAHFVGHVRSLDDLSVLPTISKADLAAHSHELLTSSEFPAHLGLTSGTTHEPGNLSPPTIYYRSREELALAEKLIASLTGGPEVPSNARELVLQIVGATHGVPTIPPPGMLIAPFERPFHLGCIVDLLRREFAFDGFPTRVTALASSLNRIKVLATVIDRHASFLWDEMAISTLAVSGSHLTPRWQRLLAEWFGARVVNRYGLSEVAFSDCVQCETCSGFHLPPLLIPEVISVWDGEVLTEGYGELTLTTLHPFTSLQPLIRYRTGDLVRIVPSCPALGGSIVQLWGRLVTSPKHPESKTIVPSSIVHELLDELTDVRRDPFPMAAFGIDTFVGVPRYQMSFLELEDPILRIEVEAAFEPKQYGVATERLRADIVNGLTIRLIEAGLPVPGVQVSVLSKNMLPENAERFKP